MKLGISDEGIKRLSKLSQMEDIDEELARAAQVGDIDIIQNLLKAGANPEANEYAAINVASYNGHEDVVQLLIDSGATNTEQLMKALHSAENEGYTNVANVLMDYLSSQGVTEFDPEPVDSDFEEDN